MLDNEEFQELKERVEALEAGILGEPTSLRPGPNDGELYESLVDRVTNLEAGRAPRRHGGGVSPPSREQEKSIVDSKVIANLSLLTDDKSAFRQWDAKMINALSHLKPGCGVVIEKMKEIIDQGRDPDDARPATTAERLSPVSGPSLADLLLAYSEHEDEIVDIDQLSSDLSFILIDKAKIGSSILHRIQNLKAHGGLSLIHI